jgi:hypothetical protein
MDGKAIDTPALPFPCRPPDDPPGASPFRKNRAFARGSRELEAVAEPAGKKALAHGQAPL